LRFDRQAGRSEGAQDFQGDDSGVALQPSLIQKLTCPKMDMRSDTLSTNGTEARHREL